MNFLGGIAAGIRGGQEYDLYQRQRQADLQAQQIRQFQLDQAQQQAMMQRQQMQRQPDIDRYAFQGLQGMPREMQAPQIPAPPQQPTPQPGQASAPMQAAPDPQVIARLQRDVQGLSRELTRPLNPEQKQIIGSELEKTRAQLVKLTGQPPPVSTPNEPQPPQGGGMMRTGMSAPSMQGQPQQPQIPPYRTMDGVTAQQPQGMAQVPPPPQPQQPRLNSMSMQDAARAIQSMNIKDPTTAMAVLERMKPFLTEEAKQEAALLRVQNVQQANQIRDLILNERIRHDGVTEGQGDRKAATGEKNADTAAQRLVVAEKKAKVAEERMNNPDAKLSDDALDFMAEQALAGDKSVYQNLGRGAQGSANITALRGRVQQKAKEKGVGGADLATLNAEFEGLKSGERTLGTRTANVGMAVNEANLLSDLALKASSEWTRTGIKSLNELEKYAQSKTASPELRRFVAANNSFINAYARAISPSGTPTVSDKDHAREMLEVAFSKGDYQATIEQLKLEMGAAQESPKATKKDLRELAGTGGGALPSGWSVKVK